MKTLDLRGITYIAPLEGTAEWYFGLSYEHGDLYEAEELHKAGRPVEGRNLCLIHYPEGRVFWPAEKKTGTYTAEPVYLDGCIYILLVDFNARELKNLEFPCAENLESTREAPDTEFSKAPIGPAVPSKPDAASSEASEFQMLRSAQPAGHPEARCAVRLAASLPLGCITDCYNLQLCASPLTLTRQKAATNEFEIVWPERVSFRMEDRESFFLRDGDRLFFNKWYEDGPEYWEETVVRSLSGQVLEVLPGDVRRMPGGELWHVK